MHSRAYHANKRSINIVSFLNIEHTWEGINFFFIFFFFNREEQLLWTYLGQQGWLLRTVFHCLLPYLDVARPILPHQLFIRPKGGCIGADSLLPFSPISPFLGARATFVESGV